MMLKTVLANAGYDPVGTLYMTLAGLYACCGSACRYHAHPPWQLYMLSAGVHAGLAALHVLLH